MTHIKPNKTDMDNNLCFPRSLMTDPKYKHLSTEAKLLYAVLLDLSRQSDKNGWFFQSKDGKKWTFVPYTVLNAMDVLGCGRDKAVKAFGELEQVFLIGRETDKIFVRNLFEEGNA